MISPSQMRMARAALSLSQAQVGASVGMSAMKIMRIEKGITDASASDIKRITMFFENNGLEFTDSDGVRFDRDVVQLYKGEDCYLNFLDKIISSDKKTGSEILFSGADERKSSTEAITRFNHIRKLGIKMRSLIPDQNTIIMGELDEYRWLNSELSNKDGDVKIIFQNTVAYLMSWLGSPRIVAIKDSRIAHEATKTFNYIWNQSKKPTKSTSEIKYND